MNAIISNIYVPHVTFLQLCASNNGILADYTDPADVAGVNAYQGANAVW